MSYYQGEKHAVVTVRLNSRSKSIQPVVYRLRYGVFSFFGCVADLPQTLRHNAVRIVRRHIVYDSRLRNIPFGSRYAKHRKRRFVFGFAVDVDELRYSCASLLIACGVSLKEIQEWLGHSAISTTADIYSHLNYSSKLNVANTLTNVFGGTSMNLGRQDDEEAKALLTALFRGAEHEQAETLSKPVEAVTDEIMPIPEETVKTDFADDLADLDESIAEYKKAKREMQRLGFTDYDEYLDYLEFTQRRAARKSDMEM